jgi:hypothetical protein
MVTDAAWTDVRGSVAPELVVVGEWMPLTVFENQGERLIDRTDAAGFAETHGWWRSVHAADLNGDGTPDLVAGNLGLNSRLRATPDEPARLYLNDFDDNGQSDPIFTVYRNGTSYPYADRDVLLQQIPSLEEQFPTYASFGGSQIDDVFPSTRIQNATIKTAQTFASVYAENQGDGTFAVDSLPSRAQFAPMYGVLTHDLCRDGAQNILMGGNVYGVKPKQGRYDASYGTLLRRDSSRWTPISPSESSLYLSGEVRALRILRRPDDANVVLVARNNAQPRVVSFPDASPSDTAR